MSSHCDHDETVLTRLRRAVGYALPSSLALFCGYWIHSGKLSILDHNLLLLIAAGCISLPFYSAYSATFSPRRSKLLDPSELHQEKDTFLVLCLIGSIVAILIALLHNSIAQERPRPSVIFSLLIFPVCLSAYGAFLLWWYPRLQTPLLRYQLIWPVCLSIAFPFYVGSTFSFLKVDASYLFPPTLFVIYLIIAECFGRTSKRFIWISGFVIVFSLLMTFVKPFHAALLSFLFAIAVAAYAAVFESWSVTAREASFAKDITPRVTKYYLGTMAALIGSGFSVSVLYIFSAFGSVFLWLVGIHFILAFIIWYHAAPPTPSLYQREYWARDKVLMGMAIFAILLADALLRGTRIPNYLSLLTSSVTVSILAGIWSIVGLTKRLPPRSFVELSDYFLLKQRFVETLWPFFLLIFAISYGVYINADKYLTAPYATRVSLGAGEVFDLYLLFTLLALIYLFFTRDSGDGKSNALQQLGAIMLLVRIFTSIIVGGGVCLALFVKLGQFRANAIISIPFILACMGGFAINDFFDKENDSINRPYRAIPKKVLSSQQVLIIAVILLGAAIISGVWVGSTLIDQIIYISTVVGVIFYNVIVRYFGVGKTLYTGILASLPYIMVIIKGRFESRYWFFIAAAVIFVTGRELLMDAHDEKGDRIAERDTLAIRLGSQKALNYGTYFQVLGAIVLIPIAMFADTITSAILVLAAIATAFACVLLQYCRVAPRICIYACWIPMLLGLATLWVR